MPSARRRVDEDDEPRRKRSRVDEDSVDEPPRKKKKKKKRKSSGDGRIVIIVVVLAVLLIGGGGLGAWLIMRDPAGSPRAGSPGGLNEPAGKSEAKSYYAKWHQATSKLNKLDQDLNRTRSSPQYRAQLQNAQATVNSINAESGSWKVPECATNLHTALRDYVQARQAQFQFMDKLQTLIDSKKPPPADLEREARQADSNVQTKLNYLGYVEGNFIREQNLTIMDAPP